LEPERRGTRLRLPSEARYAAEYFDDSRANSCAMRFPRQRESALVQAGEAIDFLPGRPSCASKGIQLL